MMATLRLTPRASLIVDHCWQGDLMIDRASEHGIADALAAAVPLADPNHELKLTSVKVGALADRQAVAAQLADLTQSSASNVDAASTGALVGFELLAADEAGERKLDERLQSHDFSAALEKQLASRHVGGVGVGSRLVLAISPPIAKALQRAETERRTSSGGGMLLGVAGAAVIVVAAAAAAGCRLQRKAGYHELESEVADAHRSRAMEMSASSNKMSAEPTGTSRRYEEELEI